MHNLSELLEGSHAGYYGGSGSFFAGPASRNNGATNGASANMNFENTMPIAIIGMSCKFPGDVTSPEKLWDLCSSARSTWSSIPKERFNQDALYHQVKERSGTVSTDELDMLFRLI
jgi:hypothetical protein